MTPHEERSIIQWSRNLTNPVKLYLFLTNDQRSNQLRMFCNELAGLVERIDVVENWQNSAELPYIALDENLRYFAVPGGSELAPFLEALSMKSDNVAVLPGLIKEAIERINESVTLRLFVSQHCPHCPKSVRDFVPLTVVNGRINLAVIDGTLFWELAQTEDIQCLPTVLLGDKFRWSGVTPLEDIVEVIANRDPDGLSFTAIERMIEEGNAIKVAQMMIDSDRIFPAIADLMIDERFVIRLGALAAMEEVVRQNIELASEAVILVWNKFEQAIEPMQIDILYFIGDAGKRNNIPMLESVINGNYRDHVKQAAIEAIESIMNRN